MGRVTDTRRYQVSEESIDVSLVPLDVGDYEVAVGHETHQVVIVDINECDLTVEIDGLAEHYHYCAEISRDNLLGLERPVIRVGRQYSDPA